MNLIGKYNFTRTIEDYKAQQKYQYSGTLNISENKWYEQGYNQDGLSFFRSYNLQMLGEGIRFCFDDGRHFFTLNSLHGEQDILHLCGRDSYKGQWHLQGNDLYNSLYLSWLVNGPAKDYYMQSFYTKEIS